MKENALAVTERKTLTREAWRYFQNIYHHIFGDNVGHKGLKQLVFSSKKPFFPPYGLPIEVRKTTNAEGADVYEPWGYDEDKEKWFRLCCGGGSEIDDEAPEVTRMSVIRRSEFADDTPPEITNFEITKASDN